MVQVLPRSSNLVHLPFRVRDTLRPSWPMAAARARHTATRLNDGRVLIAGGDADGTAEIFEPTAESFSSTLLAMAAPRIGQTAILFSDDSVLLAGGNTDSMEYFSATDQK